MSDTSNVRWKTVYADLDFVMSRGREGKNNANLNRFRRCWNLLLEADVKKLWWKFATTYAKKWKVNQVFHRIYISSLKNTSYF